MINFVLTLSGADPQRARLNALGGVVSSKARSRARAVLLAGFVVSVGTTWALDAEKFALLTTGITRAAAVEIAGTPDSEHCATSFGLRVCHLTWIPRSILGSKTAFRATFVADRLIASSTCQSAQGCAGKE